jgi:putative RNA 2'-phosphotransferase
LGNRKDPKQLLKLITYVLEHRPDEFGLVPDAQGFVPIKDLIRALNEEAGWGYVRKSHIQEILLTCRDHPFVIEGDLIRGRLVHETGARSHNVIPPKILYGCVRRKAYPVVCEKGIVPMGRVHVLLCTTQDMALRIGRRRDPKPVLLTVQAQRLSQQGVVFLRQGESIFLVDHVPVGLFSGPPLAKEKPQEVGKKKETPAVKPPIEPGAFFLDMERSEELQRQEIKRKGLRKEIDWKRAARKMRRRK